MFGILWQNKKVKMFGISYYNNKDKLSQPLLILAHVTEQLKLILKNYLITYILKCD